MTSDNQGQDVNMSTNMDTGKRVPLPVEGSPTLAGNGPSVSNDPTEYSVQKPESTGNEPEEEGKIETLDDNALSKSGDSNQNEGAEQQSNPLTIVKINVKTHQHKLYEIKTDAVGNEWFCAEGNEQETVYHSDIRYDLEHYSEQTVPPGGRRYLSMLGAGTDDITSYHPRFDFCGKDRDDRPDCLFYLYKPAPRQAEEPIHYLVWKGRIVLDYKREPIRALDLPLTISSKIGNEEARLEAMLRLNSGADWSDILARILHRGDTSRKAANTQNRLNMCQVRFRSSARLLSFGKRSGSKALETYILTRMTAEMVVKNTTKGLTDLIDERDEKAYIELLNLGIRNKNSRAQSNEESKKANPMTPEERKKKEKWRKELKGKLTQANAWAQAWTAWEAQNPTPAPSIYGDTECTAIESIVAFRLASMNQYRRDGSVAFKAGFTLEHAAPRYAFNNPRMEEFFGSPAYLGDEAFLLPDANDPYGLLSSPTVTAAQTCLVDFLLEPARMQYRQLTLVWNEFGKYDPIFTTNPKDSYWQQLRTLQSAFEQHWAEVGRTGHPPVLYGLLKLDYDTMTWNVDEVPVLALVWQYIDSCTRTFAIWQRRQAEDQRAKLRQKQGELEDDEKDSGGHSDDEDGDEVMMEEREGGEGDVVMEGSEGAEEVEETELE